MIDLLQDLSVLTNVSNATWSSMKARSSSLLSHYIVEAILNQQSDVQVDIGLGYLFIHIQDEDIQFRFEPAEDVCRKIRKAVKTGTSSLVEDVDAELGKRFSSTYKELI